MTERDFQYYLNLFKSEQLAPSSHLKFGNSKGRNLNFLCPENWTPSDLSSGLRSLGGRWQTQTLSGPSALPDDASVLSVYGSDSYDSFSYCQCIPLLGVFLFSSLTNPLGQKRWRTVIDTKKREENAQTREQSFIGETTPKKKKKSPERHRLKNPKPKTKTKTNIIISNTRVP